jgi:hypothetical protein
LSIGFDQDSYWIIYVVPGILVVMGLAWMLFNERARWNLQPNREYPLLRRLPPGTPPALLRDEATGQMRPAGPPSIVGAAVDGGYDIQIGRHHLPLVCCECLQPATKEHAVSITVSGATKLEIPHCADCDRLRSPGPRATLAFLVASGIFVVALVLAMWSTEASNWLCIAGSLILGLLASFFVIAWISLIGAPPEPVEVVNVDGDRGVVTLKFRNAEFGRLVGDYLRNVDAGSRESSTGPAPEARPPDPQFRP